MVPQDLPNELNICLAAMLDRTLAKSYLSRHVLRAMR